MKRAAALSLIACLASLPAAAQQPGPEKTSRDLLEMIHKRQFPGAVSLFDAGMRESLPEKKLEAAWDSLAAKGGRFEYLGPARPEPAAGAQAVRILCVFEKAAFDARVVLDKEGRVSGLFFIPAAQPTLEEELRPMPSLFAEREVTIGNGEWALRGTLTMPAKGRPAPAVVLVHGSGPHDRDETIGPNKPFRDIAWGLAARGVAVLRYEKRTKEHAKKLEPHKDRITPDEETVDDALEAVKFLRGTEGVDPKRIFVLGHSLGGMLAPRIAARDRDIAGIIVLAAPSRPLEDVILDQITYILSRSGAPSGDEKAQLDRLREKVARVKAPSLSDKTPAAELPLGIPAAYWLALRGYDPAAEARGLNRPVLVLQGGRDYQVTEADFEGWKKALGSSPGARFRWFPNMNHLFVSGEKKSVPEEYLSRRTMEGSVLDEIASWINN